MHDECRGECRTTKGFLKDRKRGPFIFKKLFHLYVTFLCPSRIINSVYLKMLLNLARNYLYRAWSRTPGLISPAQTQRISTNGVLYKVEDRKEMLASLPAKDEGTAGEKSIDIDNLFNKLVFFGSFQLLKFLFIYILLTDYRKQKFFPDVSTPTELFDGTPFNELPICNIRVTHNNTIISFTDAKGRVNTSLR